MATTLPDEVRGRAGGWYNAGNLGGGALGAGVTLWLADHSSPRVVAIALMVMTAGPSLAAFALDEADRVRRSAKQIFGTMLRDVWSTVKSRTGIIGIIFCLSPVGTAAAMNLFSAIAVDYHAPTDTVTFVTGFLGGLITAVGSVLGGMACDRINRRFAYALSGALTAASAILMALMPLTPFTYTVGSSLYLLVAGFCYAAFSALVLEVVGRAGASASTQYTLFTAAGNQAIGYVSIIDGKGYKHFGPRGLLGADAVANLVGIVFVVLMSTLVMRAPKADKAALAA
jgi:MFS family permease